MTSRGRLSLGIVALVVAMLASLGMSSAARADFGLSMFEVSLHDAANNPVTQAGSHPDLTVHFGLNTYTDPNTGVVPDGDIRNVTVDMPKGFYGNPQAVPLCPRELATGSLPGGCPADTMIGTVAVDVGFTQVPAPLYNVVPEDGQAADFVGVVYGGIVNVVATVSAEGEPHVRTSVRNINEGLRFLGVYMTLWGVPADPAHDGARGGASDVLARPLLTAPSDCSQTPTVRLHAESWDAQTADASAPLPNPTGCEQLAVSHGISVQPTNPRAGTPSGYDIDLDVPQDDNPNHLGTAPLKRVAVTLPEGVALSPATASAIGLTGCTDAQLAAGTDAEPTCPGSSKIGTVSITTPLLPEDLEGTVYLGAPTPDAMFRVFMVVHGPGVLLKIPGTVRPDPTTGQLTAVFDDLPEVPFSHLNMHLKGGDTAPLVNPQTCGTKLTSSTVTAWAGATSSADAAFIISGDGQGGPCPATQPFEPSLEAGTTNAAAGKTAPLVLNIAREDGEQNVSAIGVTLPEGLLAKLAGVPLCPAASAPSGDCPDGSQVGSVKAAVGSGSQPLWLPQAGKAPTAIYLAGPYKGAPYSLVIKVPAQAGPFDLGDAVTRAGINIDPVTTQVTIKSDPLPQILEGVPVEYRHIYVAVDRPDFTVNPTSCGEMQIGSTITSTQGATASPSSRFELLGCRELGFKPMLSMSFKGATHRGGHPKLRAVLKARKGDANIGRASVTLPHAAFLDQAHIRTVCTRVQFAADACPKGSIYGRATAYSPLLGYPLSGPVYLRSSNHPLPDLVTRLRGPAEQPIEIDLDGRIDSVHGALRTTFAQVPDAPISRFVLQMFGGKRGLIELSSDDYCAGKHRVKAAFKGQNGARSVVRPLLGNGSC